MGAAAKLARDLRFALDRTQLFKDCTGFDPDPLWQKPLLESDWHRVILNLHRQAGKSSITGVIACDEARLNAGSTTLVCCPVEDQSQELLKKCLAYFHAIDEPIANESAYRIELKNKSRIIALPGSETSVRGFSAVSLVIYDEASRIQDELFVATRPSTATVQRARIFMLSTPQGMRGRFYETWRQGGPFQPEPGSPAIDLGTGRSRWVRLQVRAADCPRIDPAFLAEELADMGPSKYSQEYECAFISNDEQLISSELIEAALSDDDTFRLR